MNLHPSIGGLSWHFAAFTLASALVTFGATDAEVIGLTHLRNCAPGLTGKGVVVAHPESSESGWSAWQVTPEAVSGRKEALIWISNSGLATNYPNTLGRGSSHANSVASRLYGLTEGTAPGIDHVQNYEASCFFTSLVQPQIPMPARVVNQSYVLFNQSAGVDEAYDNYAARYGTLFVAAVGNSGGLKSPATAFNGISVAAFGSSSSVGPTTDGRCKPDITAPASATSFAAPLVSGAAALLLQAAEERFSGDSAATDSRTVKALLLNGAVKPQDWTNSPAAPLDRRHGAGVLNVYNSFQQLCAGRVTNAFTGAGGWDLNSISSTGDEAGFRRYQLKLQGEADHVVSFTLVWHRQHSQSAINNLDLILYRGDTGGLVAASASTVDNLEHLSLANLPAGKYELVVMKHGSDAGFVSPEETYALAVTATALVRPQLRVVSAAPGSFHGQVVGKSAHRLEVLYTTDFKNWNSLTNGVASESGVLDFFDFATPGVSMRFYRGIETE